MRLILGLFPRPKPLRRAVPVPLTHARRAIPLGPSGGELSLANHFAHDLPQAKRAQGIRSTLPKQPKPLWPATEESADQAKHETLTIRVDRRISLFSCRGGCFPHLAHLFQTRAAEAALAQRRESTPGFPHVKFHPCSLSGKNGNSSRAGPQKKRASAPTAARNPIKIRSEQTRRRRRSGVAQALVVPGGDGPSGFRASGPLAGRPGRP